MRFVLRVVSVILIVSVAIIYGCQGLTTLGEKMITQDAQDITAKYPDPMAVEDFSLMRNPVLNKEPEYVG